MELAISGAEAPSLPSLVQRRPETWKKEEIQLWLREEMGMPHVADAVGERRMFHGHMLTSASQEVWSGLGADTLDANMLHGEVQRLLLEAAKPASTMGAVTTADSAAAATPGLGQ